MSLDPVIHSFSYAIGYLNEQVADVADADLARQPTGVPNHPAWTIGHLIFIAQAIGAVAGLEPWLDARWAELFGPGSISVDDSAAYPSKMELLASLADAERRLADAVRGIDQTALDAEFPDPAYRDVFPTVRHALTQVLVGHTSFHVGQISVWRRAMGLTAMARSFE